jgi:biotin carboxyl carrier protein
MKFEVRIGGLEGHGQKTRSVELEREGTRPAPGPSESEKLLVRLDGREVKVDAVEVSARTYSILLGGRSFEVRVEPSEGGVEVHTGSQVFRAQVLDPRAWRGKRGAVVKAEGRQQVTAPMPGKVVRVLVAAGDAVEAGRGLLVVEAMKMQNEIRAPKTGKVERLLVVEGQAVNAGEVLAVVG